MSWGDGTGAVMLASLPPRVVPWFVERDRFVRDVRAERCCGAA
jgi:hypothetical protein